MSHQEVKMDKHMCPQLLQEMEQLRKELYSVVNGNRKLLMTKETYAVSTKLDELIVKHMRDQARQLALRGAVYEYTP
ncbi:Spo0E family sporulation regulatory protein-aspartic acid phosphatase [Thermanaerosceptrum fracticalcis]|uniref:Spo0E family sporulation regulatory protein-aspartic acid phosphatase n=2 Tax=Thermanaerosceptrum fracticalcis TaxID=1712410 RepID=A0A7G6E470_THEFR|nr:Spo0E family sporulation regulatory protein-aspartic acid phosphatase [Thermanaerosceptrum fracticalcis]